MKNKYCTYEKDLSCGMVFRIFLKGITKKPKCELCSVTCKFYVL